MTMDRLSRIPLVLRALAVALVLSGTLAWMIVDRARLLQTGREIVLKTEPMDPRDIFRGHYARLNYEISRIPRSLVEDLRPDTRATGGSAMSLNGPGSGDIAVDYGIERYYASRKRALEVERLGRDRKVPMGVIVRVSPTGKAAIAGLMIEGRKAYEEPLW